MDYKNRVYVVTGASSGMGRSCAEQLLQEGAKVIGFDVHESSIASADYKHYVVSITDETAVIKCVEEIAKDYGRIDGLVNAAGIWGNSKPFYEIETADWQRVVDTNLTGAFIMSKHISKIRMMERQGKIVNISCIRSAIYRNNMADYASAKGGIVSLTSAMALDLAPYNIQVNAVAPGFIYTGMTKTSFDNPEVKAESERLIPNGRLGMPSDIASVVLFLLSDGANYMTGTNVFADGGYHIQK